MLRFFPKNREKLRILPIWAILAVILPSGQLRRRKMSPKPELLTSRVSRSLKNRLKNTNLQKRNSLCWGFLLTFPPERFLPQPECKFIRRKLRLKKVRPNFLLRGLLFSKNMSIKTQLMLMTRQSAEFLLPVMKLCLIFLKMRPNAHKNLIKLTKPLNTLILCMIFIMKRAKTSSQTVLC